MLKLGMKWWCHNVMYGVAFMNVGCDDDFLYITSIIFVVTEYYFCREALLFYVKNLSSSKQNLKLKNF